MVVVVVVVVMTTTTGDSSSSSWVPQSKRYLQRKLDKREGWLRVRVYPDVKLIPELAVCDST
jgi:hypothetical protein